MTSSIEPRIQSSDPAIYWTAQGPVVVTLQPLMLDGEPPEYRTGRSPSTHRAGRRKRYSSSSLQPAARKARAGRKSLGHTPTA